MAAQRIDYPVSPSQVMAMRCVSVPVLSKMSVIFTLCVLIAVTPIDAVISPTDESRQEEKERYHAELEYHKFAIENPPEEDSPLLLTPIHDYSRPLFTPHLQRTTTTIPPQLVPDPTIAPGRIEDPSSDEWRIMVTNDFYIPAKWVLAALACCLSIPAIIAWILPLVSTCARAIANFVFTVLDIATWCVVIVLVLRGPTQHFFGTRVPLAAYCYAETGAAILVFPVISFLCAFLMFLMFEVFLHRTYISKQARSLIASARSL